jgi:hypothetical protein
MSEMSRADRHTDISTKTDNTMFIFSNMLKSCNGHDYEFQYNFTDALYFASYMAKLRSGTKI